MVYNIEKKTQWSSLNVIKDNVTCICMLLSGSLTMSCMKLSGRERHRERDKTDYKTDRKKERKQTMKILGKSG
jgi:hypothetical protein